MLLAHGAAQRDHVLGGVVALEAGPARVGRPLLGEVGGALRLVARTGGRARGAAGGRGGAGAGDRRRRRDGAERAGAARVLGRGAAADDGGPVHGCLLVVRRPAWRGPAGPVGGPRRGPCFDLPPAGKPFSSPITRKNRGSSLVRKEWRVSLSVMAIPTTRPAGIAEHAEIRFESEPDALTIGRRIRHLRTARGMTLDELGAAIGRAPSQVSLLENGKREPKFGQLQAVARALGASLDDLLSPEAPSRRDALEIELERAQRGPLFDALGLRPVRVGKSLPTDALETIVALERELQRLHTERAATPEEARRANAELRATMRAQDNYFPELEDAAAGLLDGVGHAGGPMPQRVAADLAAHLGSRCTTSATCRTPPGPCSTCATAACTCRATGCAGGPTRRRRCSRRSRRTCSGTRSRATTASSSASASRRTTSPRRSCCRSGTRSRPCAPRRTRARSRSRTSGTRSRCPTRPPRTGSPTSRPSTSGSRCTL